jgi:hypothetical protein
MEADCSGKPEFTLSCSAEGKEEGTKEVLFGR